MEYRKKKLRYRNNLPKKEKKKKNNNNREHKRNKRKLTTSNLIKLRENYIPDIWTMSMLQLGTWTFFFGVEILELEICDSVNTWPYFRLFVGFSLRCTAHFWIVIGVSKVISPQYSNLSLNSSSSSIIWDHIWKTKIRVNLSSRLMIFV